MSAKILICIDGTASREPGYAGGAMDHLQICATNESNTHKFFRMAIGGQDSSFQQPIGPAGSRGGFAGYDGGLAKMFEHGPDQHATGWDCGRILDRAWEWLGRKLRDTPQAEIFLVGHSRGGHIVTEIAIRLRQRRVGDTQPMITSPGSVRRMGPVQPVRFLGLFDAVDMTTSLGNTTEVPSNVQTCYHIMRSREAGSRRAWGNTATRAATGVEFKTSYLNATHGAIGGAFPEDCEGGINRNIIIGTALFGGVGGAVVANVHGACAIPLSAEQNAAGAKQAYEFVKKGAAGAGLVFE